MARVLFRDHVFEVGEEELAALPDSPLKHVDPEPRYTIRTVSDEHVERLKAKHTKQKWVQHQLTQETNGIAYFADLVDDIIVSWTGVLEESGDPMPCTKETKTLLAEDLRLAIVKRARMNRIVPKEDSFRTTESPS